MEGGNEITFAAIDNYPKLSAQRVVFDMQFATLRWNCLQTRLAKQAPKIRDRVS